MVVEPRLEITLFWIKEIYAGIIIDMLDGIHILMDKYTHLERENMKKIRILSNYVTLRLYL